MRKLIILLLFLTAVRVLLSCCKGEGYSFRWSKTTLINLTTSTDRPQLLTQDSSKIDKYGFRLLFDHEKVAYNSLNGLAFNETYAFDCVSFFRNKDSIRSMDIITRNNFDNTHSGGSSIAEYLLARPADFYNYYPEYQYKPVNDNLRFLNDDQDKSIHNNGLDFKFKTVSPILGQHRFIINVLFKSGRVLSDSTSIKLI